MEEITASWVRGRLPRRDPMGHKGIFGKVLCICGSVGFSGAARAFCSRFSFRLARYFRMAAFSSRPVSFVALMTSVTALFSTSSCKGHPSFGYTMESAMPLSVKLSRIKSSTSCWVMLS